MNTTTNRNLKPALAALILFAVAWSHTASAGPRSGLWGAGHWRAEFFSRAGRAQLLSLEGEGSNEGPGLAPAA